MKRFDFQAVLMRSMAAVCAVLTFVLYVNTCTKIAHAMSPVEKLKAYVDRMVERETR